MADYQDFTSAPDGWVTRDDNGKLTVSARIVAFLNLARNGDHGVTYVQKDYGVGLGVVDGYEHRFDAQIESRVGVDGYVFPWGLQTVAGATAINYSNIELRYLAGDLVTTLVTRTGLIEQDTWTNPNTFDKFYYRVYKEGVNLICKIYSDSSFRAQVGDTLSVTDKLNPVFPIRFINVVSLATGGAGSGTLTGTVNNLDLAGSYSTPGGGVAKSPIRNPIPASLFVGPRRAA